jgi:hypothetical protein
VHVPQWLTIVIAVIVIAFGLYRIRMSFVKVDPDAPKKSLMGGGLYRMSPRTHLFIGVIYLALGGALIATTFGWNPLNFGAKEPAPAAVKKPN